MLFREDLGHMILGWGGWGNVALMLHDPVTIGWYENQLEHSPGNNVDIKKMV